MRTAFGWKTVFLFAAWMILLAFPASLPALDEGVVTGRIADRNAQFLRDYETLDYREHTAWQEWGKGLKSLGWVVVQGDSGEVKDYLLLIVDTRTRIKKTDGSPGSFGDLVAGGEVTASYRMGWDALHALDLTILR